MPFLLLCSAQLTIETILALCDHHMVVWSQHSVKARSDDSIIHTLDLVEYAETAAHYEYLNLTAGCGSEGLTPEHLRAVAESWKIRQNIF